MLKEEILKNYLSPELTRKLINNEVFTEAEKAQSDEYLNALLNVIRTYIPRHLANRVEKETILPRAEFMSGTTMFADISGFTAMSETLSQLGKAGAEEITRVVNSYFTRMLDIIKCYNGILLRFGGDAMMIFFSGEEEEKHSEFAVRAGLDMQKAMIDFQNVETSKGNFTLRMSIGINSGTIFAAEVGIKERIEYVITGKAINATGAAESIAKAGQVLITNDTFELLKDIINVKAIENMYQVLDIKVTLDKPTKEIIIPSLPDNFKERLIYYIREIERLKPYLPEGLFVKIASNPKRVGVEGEHRLVTVLFANFYDFSEIIEELGEEHTQELAELLNRYFIRMLNIVTYYGGTINKIDMYTYGDKLMVLFGAPIAHEDDPERAVRASLEMQDIMNDFRTLETSKGTFSLKQKIGVNTGYVFAGNVGSSWRKEYSVMGDTVNSAARLMSVCKTSEVVIRETTYQKVNEIVEAEELEKVKVKGKKEPLTIYRPLHIKETRQKVKTHRFIGREKERKLLQDKIKNLLKERKLHIISITGEAGIGKTYLRIDLEEYIEEKELPVSILFSEVPSYGQGSVYQTIINLLRKFFGFRSSDTEEEILSHFYNKIRELIPNLEIYTPLLGNVLSIPIPENEIIRNLSEEQRSKRTYQLIKELLAAQSKKKPLVLLLENAQWIDSTSLELLDYLMNNLEESAILLITFQRTEFIASWMTTEESTKDTKKKKYTKLTLNPFSEIECTQLVQILLLEKSISDDLHQLVWQKSQGNTFYIAEVVKSLLETGFLRLENEIWELETEQGIPEIPDTLNGLVMSHIDRLGEKIEEAVNKIF